MPRLRPRLVFGSSSEVFVLRCARTALPADGLVHVDVTVFCIFMLLLPGDDRNIRSVYVAGKRVVHKHS